MPTHNSREQDHPSAVRDGSLAQLNVAKAAQQSAKLALDSEIGGVNTTVAQMQAQLENAVWELSQTTIRAPADGYVNISGADCRRSRAPIAFSDVVYRRK